MDAIARSVPPPVAPQKNGAPLLPTSMAETGLHPKFLNALTMKCLFVLGLETIGELAEQMKLSSPVLEQILNGLRQQALVEVRGSAASNVTVLRYALTGAGKEIAAEACRQCEYVGPAPVPLKTYQEQVRNQSIASEKVSVQDLAASLSHLVLSDRLAQRLGPAVNSARSLLVYGPPGNGKTSISEAVGKAFKQPIWIPHCFEVDGQVIRVYDPTVHSEIQSTPVASGHNLNNLSLLQKRPDTRWVKCRRPTIIVGGELTLDMLDLEYDTVAKFYEAPPQVKALGGIFLIDDFGRQLVQPADLLNRWIIPLEKKVDYLTIHTGKKFDIPFDELVIFSTNIAPTRLMDAALMRRVKYKLRIEPPGLGEYVTIFKRVCSQFGLELPQEILDFLIEDYYPHVGKPYAAFHPIFIVEHAIAACRYMGEKPALTPARVRDALENLFVTEDQEQDLATPLEALLQATG